MPKRVPELVFEREFFFNGIFFKIILVVFQGGIES